VARIFLDAVLVRAAELHSQELAKFAQALGIEVGNAVGAVLANAFR
jgi:hypothetical protein